MKYLIFILFAISTIICKAQSPIIPLKNMYKQDFVVNAYYKDLDGDLDKYVGTWKYTNGNSSLTIEFRKLIQYYSPGLQIYEDTLIAEYKYTENGVIILNYLNRLNDSSLTVAEHYINGNDIIYPKEFVDCDTCAHLERRIKLFFSDPLRSYLPIAMAVRHVTVNGIEKIEMNLRDDGTYVEPYVGAPRDARVPYGDYTLIKQ